MTARDALARRQRFEVLAGAVGFFALMSLVNAVGLIVAGRPSVLASVVLVGMLVLCVLTWRAWLRVDRAVREG